MNIAAHETSLARRRSVPSSFFPRPAVPSHHVFWIYSSRSAILAADRSGARPGAEPRGLYRALLLLAVVSVIRPGHAACAFAFAVTCVRRWGPCHFIVSRLCRLMRLALAPFAHLWLTLSVDLFFASLKLLSLVDCRAWSRFPRASSLPRSGDAASCSSLHARLRRRRNPVWLFG